MRKCIFCLLILILIAGSAPLWAQQPRIPTPATYNYTEANGCAACHITRGASALHMAVAVGVSYAAASNSWSLTGRGWLASRHSQSNYISTQNTFCARCHSPIQGSVNATMYVNQPVATGAMEAVTCAVCHPSNAIAAIIGRRVAIYTPGGSKTSAASYTVVHEGQEDLLCLNCHVERHNESDATWRRMYEAEVRCIDCHMAVIGHTPSGAVEERAHDFRVAANLPYSCGVDGSIVVCHPGYSAQETLSYIPILKGQHRNWWPQGQSQ